MAEIIKNEKGFKIFKVTLEEVQKNFRGLGICDWCVKSCETFMYIPVLHSCYCKKCYNRWNKKAVNYPEDHDFENMVFEKTKKLLNLE